MKHVTTIMLVVSAVLVFNSIAIGGNPAPYTTEAYQKIESISKRNPPKIHANMSREDRFREDVNNWREVYKEAGYNYDDTIVKVINDMRTNPTSIPKSSNSIASMIYVSLHISMSECNSAKVDCLKLYRSDAAESIRWLLKNSKFGF